MKTADLKNVLVYIICLLYILLFVYAAANKALDFQSFKVQLGQSPLLSAFAEYVAWAIPFIELSIVTLLIIPRFRQFALYASFWLMSMFTAYIVIILNYSSFVPCSCGGILEKLGWKEHLVFNVAFVILAAIAIFLNPNQFNDKKIRWHIIRILGVLIILSSGTVIALFLMSENITHYHNKFVRRFQHWPAVKTVTADLRLNSYYIAGIDSSNIYLGNNTAPFLITIYNRSLQYSGKHVVTPTEKDFLFHAVQVRVQPPYFYILDGMVPCVFKGSTRDWKPKLIKKGGEFFSLIAPIDSATIAVRTSSRKNGSSIMGILNLRDTSQTILNTGFLQKQHDGVFDVDGILVYSEEMQRIVYLYAYRNQYIVADNNGNVDFRANTIDTISHARLKIAKLKERAQRKFASPPFFVNKGCAVSNNLLFVNSAIPGPYEDDGMWKSASIIDVYNLSDQAYLLSFCIYDEDGHKLKGFTVSGDHLYALIGNRLVNYKLRESITKYYNHK